MSSITSAGLTVEEAAASLGLTAGTVRRLISHGRLHADKAGRRLNLISPDEVERYRREHLGKRGWQNRRKPDYQPSPGALASKRYRERKKAQAEQPATEPDKE